MASPHPTDPLDIVIAASEAVPYAKTGGLADVAGALPVELAKLGHRATLIIPGYPQVTSGRHSFKALADLRISLPKTQADVTLEEESVPVAKGAHPLRVVAIRYDPYFGRPGLYQSDEGDYPDNLDRFALFSRAVLETIAFLATAQGQRTDVLHLHDWQTALCAVYLKTLDQDRRSVGHVKTLLTLHNVGYQGIFPGEQFVKTGLPSGLFSPAGIEFYGSVNLLKGGILFADRVSTVSPTYAKEILTPEFGCGLEGVLAAREDGVLGIINGIDVDAWDPSTDRYLPTTYSATDLSGKRVCKRSLQRELGLPAIDVPLLAAIGRLTPQKGFDLLIEIIPELMRLNVQIAILGTGDREIERRLRDAGNKHHDRIGLAIGFDEGLAHRIEAGADMLVMPSRYEPCGLSQLYSLRYGTVPIVRRTGGLADTVVPYRPSTVQSGRATGFQFEGASSEALLSAILWALEVFKDREAWRALMLAGMKADVSWSRASRQYVELYRSLRTQE